MIPVSSCPDTPARCRACPSFSRNIGAMKKHREAMPDGWYRQAHRSAPTRSEGYSCARTAEEPESFGGENIYPATSRGAAGHPTWLNAA